MTIWTDLSSIIQSLASVLAILGINAFQITQYYRKNRSSSHAPSATGSRTVPISKVSSPIKGQELDWLDLAMALLIGGTISLVTTFIILICLRLCSYYIFLPPYHAASKVSLSEALYHLIQDVVAINFTDPRFDFAFIVGIIPGTIIGAWNGRSVLRTLAKGKGIMDWLVGNR